jgi:hypothetical protein
MTADAEAGEGTGSRWFSRGVAGIGGASLLADLGHEVPTALLPSLLTSVLHAPASALGLTEAIADGAAGLANIAGGLAGHGFCPLAQRPIWPYLAKSSVIMGRARLR